MDAIQRFLRDDGGATAIEFALAIAAIAIALNAAFGIIGSESMSTAAGWPRQATLAGR